METFLGFTLLATSSFETSLLWKYIEPYDNEGSLPFLIKERQEEIHFLKEAWRSFIKKEELYHTEFFTSFFSLWQTGTLTLVEEGSSSVYLLSTQEHSPYFIIKPVDECAYCLNNAKNLATPFTKTQKHNTFPSPLYHAAQTEALCYELALLCNLSSITPKTHLSLLSHPKFFSPFQKTDIATDLEKLCSLQEYVANSTSLYEVLEALFSYGYTEEEIQEYFDVEDFEDLSLFLWITCDSDAHPQNFRVYHKCQSPLGHPIYGIKKIDNALAFSPIHTEFSPILTYFPHAEKRLSQRIRQKIQELPTHKIQQTLNKYCFSSAFPALHERIRLLQDLSQKSHVTYLDINHAISNSRG